MANSKLTDLSATTSASTTDLIYVVTDVATTPASKKITVDNFKSGLVTTSRTVNSKALSSDVVLVLDSTDFSLSDNATNNASTTAHGLLPKLEGTGTKYLKDDGTWDTPAGGASLTKDSFTNGDLTVGVLTVALSPELSAGSEIISVVVINDDKKVIIPDDVTCGTNSFAVDLTSFGTLSGTYQVAYIA